MKQILKNLLMITIIILLCLSSYYTMNYIKNNIGNSNMSVATPPSMPSENEASTSNSEPPAKPNDDSTDSVPSSNNMMNSQTQNNTLSIIYYVIFAVIGLLISLIFIYLIMS